MLSCEVSLYPLEVTGSDEIIDQALLSLDGVEAQVGELSTFLSGSEEQVFSALKSLFTNACSRGREVAMVATIKNR